MCNIIIAYASIIIGAIIWAINKKFEPKNKIIRFTLKLLFSMAIPVALVFGYLAGEFWENTIPRALITLVETCCLWMLCFYGTSPLKTYNKCYDFVHHEFVYNDYLINWWKPWVGHIITMGFIVIFLLWMIYAVMNMPSVYGSVGVAILLTMLSAVIFFVICLLLSVLYFIVSRWIKWMLK